MTFDWLDEMPKEMKVSPSNILDDSWDYYRTEILKQSEFFFFFFFVFFWYETTKGIWTLPSFNPNVHIQILQTDLYTFLSWMAWENLINDQGIFS